MESRIYLLRESAESHSVVFELNRQCDSNIESRFLFCLSSLNGRRRGKEDDVAMTQ